MRNRSYHRLASPCDVTTAASTSASKRPSASLSRAQAVQSRCSLCDCSHIVLTGVFQFVNVVKHVLTVPEFKTLSESFEHATPSFASDYDRLEKQFWCGKEMTTAHSCS